MDDMKRYIFSLILTFLRTSSGDESDLGEFTCSSTYCSQFNDGNCQIRLCNGFNTTRVLNPNVPCDCCEYCIEHLVEGKSCYPEPVVVPKAVCGPGLACLPTDGSDSYSCQKASTACTKELDKYNQNLVDGSVGIASVKPQCTEEGEFVSKRCPFGLTCHCVDKLNNRIFGESAPGDPLSLEMHCECARDYAKAKDYGLLDVGFQRCLANGNYDPLQCIGDTCFCIDKALTVTEGPLPRTAVDLLGCFNESLYPLHSYNLDEHNYHPCELEYKRVKDDEKNYPGVNILGLQLPVCQPDGFYHRVREIGGKPKCVDPDGDILTNSDGQQYTPDTAPIDGNEDYRCNCARTSYILKSANAVQPKCCTNGSYRKWQCAAGKCFCVDHNGEELDLSGGKYEVDQGSEKQLDCYGAGETSCW